MTEKQGFHKVFPQILKNGEFSTLTVRTPRHSSTLNLGFLLRKKGYKKREKMNTSIEMHNSIRQNLDIKRPEYCPLIKVICFFERQYSKT